MSQEEVKNKLKTLTQGQKGDKVIESMAKTFKTLCDYADWSDTESVVKEHETRNEAKNIIESSEKVINNQISTNEYLSNALGLCYNIQIHLPETTNMAVYDAIFRSIKKHLM